MYGEGVMKIEYDDIISSILFGIFVALLLMLLK